MLRLYVMGGAPRGRRCAAHNEIACSLAIPFYRSYDLRHCSSPASRSVAQLVDILSAHDLGTDHGNGYLESSSVMKSAGAEATAKSIATGQTLGAHILVLEGNGRKRGMGTHVIEHLRTLATVVEVTEAETNTALKNLYRVGSGEDPQASFLWRRARLPQPLPIRRRARDYCPTSTSQRLRTAALPPPLPMPQFMLFLSVPTCCTTPRARMWSSQHPKRPAPTAAPHPHLHAQPHLPYTHRTRARRLHAHLERPRRPRRAEALVVRRLARQTEGHTTEQSHRSRGP
jgi:hypothetical protein